MTTINTPTFDIADIITLLTIDGSRDALRKSLVVIKTLDQAVIKELTPEQLAFIQDSTTKQENYEEIDKIVFNALRKVRPQVDTIDNWDSSVFYDMLKEF